MCIDVLIVQYLGLLGSNHESRSVLSGPAWSLSLRWLHSCILLSVQSLAFHIKKRSMKVIARRWSSRMLEEDLWKKWKPRSWQKSENSKKPWWRILGLVSMAGANEQLKTFKWACQWKRGQDGIPGEDIRQMHYLIDHFPTRWTACYLAPRQILLNN